MTDPLQLSGDALLAWALEAPPDELEVLLEHPGLDEEQLQAVLRRRDLSDRFIDHVGRDQAWATKYMIKSAIVMNPRTPRPLAMNFVKFLFWRDLVKVLGNIAIAPPVRVAAEHVLSDRLDDMELGEKIALARLGSREVVRTLRRTRDPRIFQALLTNPRLTENDLLPVCTDPQSPPLVLSHIARSPKWNLRYKLRLALVRNPATPAAVAMSQLITLSPKDLKEITENPSVSRAVRRAAEQVREKQAHRGGEPA